MWPYCENFHSRNQTTLATIGLDWDSPYPVTKLQIRDAECHFKPDIKDLKMQKSY